MARDDDRSMSKHEHLEMHGGQLAIVDYGQLFLRLAYAEADVKPPAGDLYAINERDVSLPNWKRLREARKRLVNALFFARRLLRQWPGATLTEISEIRRAFPRGTTPRDAISAIKERHAPIAHLFERGHGLRFMRTESDLIMTVLLALSRRGIVALPIHDAVAVPKGCATIAKNIMRAEARRVADTDIPVDIQAAGTRVLSAFGAKGHRDNESPLSTNRGPCMCAWPAFAELK